MSVADELASLREQLASAERHMAEYDEVPVVLGRGRAVASLGGMAWFLGHRAGVSCRLAWGDGKAHADSTTFPPPRGLHDREATGLGLDGHEPGYRCFLPQPLALTTSSLPPLSLQQLFHSLKCKLETLEDH